MPTDPDLILTTEASDTGWGAVQGTQKTGGLSELEEESIPYQLLRTESSSTGFEIPVCYYL